MEPRIIQQGQMILAGLSFFGDPFAESAGWSQENEIGRLWQRFIELLAQEGAQIQHQKNPETHYEVHISHPETADKGHLEVFVGVELGELVALPVEFSVKILPSTSYAVFALKGQQITGDWPMEIYGAWLPQSNYEVAHPYMFQLYDHRFKGMDRLDESELDIYVPLQGH